jgi:hypothetical protein
MNNHCQITECGALLLFPHYTVFVLDDDKSVATCPNCAKKIRAARKNGGE